MKISKLLVLSTLWLSAASVKAEVPDGVWTLQEPQGLEYTDVTFDDGVRYYLYNPGAKMFFASGNDWNTRASVATFGYEVWFTAAVEADAPEGSYVFNDNCAHPDRNLGDKTLFTDNDGSTWVDRADQGNYSWTVTKVGDSYRIQNVALIADLPDFAGKYFGWKGNMADTRLYMLAEGEGFIDWKFVTAESYLAFTASDAYAAYTNSFDCYNAAQELKTVLEEAEAIGANVADQLAVYMNTASTVEELKAAIEAAKAAIDQKKKDDVESQYDNATVANPVEVTAKFLKNYDFKGDDLTTGWSGTAFGSYGPKENAEHYNKTYDTYQDVNGGLKPGVYAVGAKAFYRAGNAEPAMKNYMENTPASKYAKLYAKLGSMTREASIVSPCSAQRTEAAGQGAESDATWTNEETGESVTYYFPNNMVAAEYYMHELGHYDNKVLIAVNAETDTLRLGVRKNSSVDGDWSIFDDFSLTYYGKGADACSLYLEEALKAYEPYVAEEGVLLTEDYVTTYNEKVNGTYTASSLEEINAILSDIDGAYNNLTKNIQLWKDLANAVANALKLPFIEKLETIGEQGTDEAFDLSDYLYAGQYDDLVAEHSLTNEELEAEIAKLAEWIAIVSEAATDIYEEGDDVTALLTNPGFDEDADINFNGAEGWTIDVTNNDHNGNITRGPLGQDNKNLMESALGKMNYCFESWHVNQFDVWQEVKNAPVGVYEIQVQGYVRCEKSGYTRGDEIEGQIPIYLYLNNATTSFPSVYSEQRDGWDYTTVESWTTEEINGYLYPNSMGGASQCFAHDMYKKTAYGLVAKKGDVMRIGVKGDVPATDDWWCIWDSFKLTYQGFQPDVVLPALQEAMTTIDTTQPMGKEWFEKADAALEAANAAIASNDGKEMFDALSDIYDLTAGIRTSVALFAQLVKANEDLGAAIYDSDNADAQAAAQQLVDNITDGIENHDFADADVEGLLLQIKEMITKLNTPDYANASDENPIDFSGVIVNPGYDEGLDGWSGTAASWSGDGFDAELFNKTYDYYQDIVGLPEGTYQMGVQGYFRAGSGVNDFKAYNENPDSLNNAFIYAMNGDSVVSSTPMIRLAAQVAAMAELGLGGDGYVEVIAATDETAASYVPNSMTTGAEVFSYDLYKNEGPIVKVGADGKLRIGLKKSVNNTDDWTLFDNWTLTYFGGNSSKEPSGDPSGIKSAEDARVMMVEFFTLDGRKANAAHKGLMIVKQTLSNGNVIVKKIQK